MLIDNATVLCYNVLSRSKEVSEMSKKIKAVMFDMDGTLVRMDEKDFTENYLRRLCAVVCPLGYDKETVVKGLWAGVAAMINNDGKRTNAEVFWDVFEGLVGGNIREREPVFEDFYRNGDFKKSIEITRPNPKAREIIDRLKKRGIRLVLATNPLFPESAQHVRMSWVGLTPDDFELITHYENSSYSKPNKEYFLTLLDHLGLSADECIMIGNNVNDDIIPAESVGITTFTVDEYLMGDLDSAPRKGTFEDMMDFLENI